VILWLDDLREPGKYGFIGAVWAKNYEEAITALKTGQVTFASLDHDLSIDDMMGSPRGEKTGYDVVCWMETHNVWPRDGVAVHSTNPAGRARMQMVVDRHYRR
jgi:hypothetical protein